MAPPGLHVKILNPKFNILMCWSAPCMAATTISVWMYELLPLWTKASVKCKCNYGDTLQVLLLALCAYVGIETGLVLEPLSLQLVKIFSLFSTDKYKHTLTFIF